jgi:sn-glycerol 3-phosphate transport system permease protein
MADRRAVFTGTYTPWLFLAPQLAITAVFFLWPAGEAFWFSMLRQDAFGLSTRFVGFENFRRLFDDPLYVDAFVTTAVFSTLVALLSMGLGLLLALAADRVIAGRGTYRTLLLWPYAVAPAVASVLWLFLVNPANGIIAGWLEAVGYDWNHNRKGEDAMALVVVASVWRQVPYNFLFFLAGLMAVPRVLHEAAQLDGAGVITRFFLVTRPMLSPITFFLFVLNVVYALFETFAVIDAVTDGGPSRATTTLVYKVYRDGNDGLDLGSAGAQSVILLILVTILTVFQFRAADKRVHYG